MSNIKKQSDTPEIEADRKKVMEMESQFDKAMMDSTLAAAGVAPPPFGTAADVVSLGRSLFTGDWGGAALDALGLIPIFGDAAKGTKIAAKVADVTAALSKAKAALNTKLFASTRENAKKYWNEIIKKNRAKNLDKELKKCTTEECKKLAKEKFEKDKSMDPGRLPSSEKGSWVGPDGKPCPKGTGLYKPDPEKNKSLYEAVKRHGKEGVPFKDGHPDFSGFPPLKDGKAIGDGGKPYQVDIEMSGNRGKDNQAAEVAYREKYGKDFDTNSNFFGTWHHEPDGVTMSFVDKNIHTAYKDADTGISYSGTAHAGGNSMWKSEDF
ncbi:HNH endonuclease [Aeromonas salmonicida]|uniref:HNH endonuclease n=1 Tax=Aeromonas salmonicida TaxID=645 RepID=UPI00223F5CAE|nr:HNH endonuclease [Aeromonas salmonicida]